ncbi:hypothetical protein EYF80_023094 [Liparis tanakae]|uniref:Uncharacterized protein n=1 Tax=Liparis tanakae TaxID=230148 RepID=A0A4Z2HN34_9TELE|nr:hypothetical protein EYF80_023094 [Liparis tanakae]
MLLPLLPTPNPSAESTSRTPSDTADGYFHWKPVAWSHGLTPDAYRWADHAPWDAAAKLMDAKKQ